MKKRKCVKETKETVFDLQKGPGFKTTIEKPETELTKELLDNGQWAKKTFKVKSSTVLFCSTVLKNFFS